MKKLLLLAIVLSIASPNCAPAYAQTVVTLGTSTSATNPQRSASETGTGLFSSTSGAVSISSTGTEIMRVNGTGVGIGTTSPSYSLSVVDSQNNTTAIQVLNPNSGSSAYTALYLGNDAATFAGALFVNSSTNTSTYGGANSLNLYAGTSSGPITFLTDATERMRITGTGHVGIGTTSPTNALDVSGAAALGTYAGTTAPSQGLIVSGPVGIGTTSPAGLLEVAGSSGVTGDVLISATGTNTAWLSLEGHGTTFLSTSFDIWDDVNQAGLIQRANLPMTFSTDNSERMRITSAGRVGIGTTTPGGNLEVNGGGSADAAALINAPSGGNTAWLSLEGAGTVYQTSSFDISDNASQATLNQRANLPMTFFTDNSERMRITSSGNVGIGTGSPAQMLEVDGEVQIDGWATGSDGHTLCVTNTDVLKYCGSSSIRYKENVKNFDRGLDDVMRMRPVKFKWKNGDQSDFGLIAEEMRDINPLYVTYHHGQVEGVKYPQLTAVIVKAVQEQQQEIADLKQEISDLKAAVAKPNVASSEGH
jgi:hypothetical protein